MSHLCDLEPIDLIVTDPAAPAALIDQLRTLGVEVVVAAGKDADQAGSKPTSPMSVAT